ncbi:hypothetical protein O3G_MSEX000427 [Manduca sexta]|nr:hypothetical protein O3G_MSEX000427 [Manduca sexta]
MIDRRDPFLLRWPIIDDADIDRYRSPKPSPRRTVAQLMNNYRDGAFHCQGRGFAFGRSSLRCLRKCVGIRVPPQGPLRHAKVRELPNLNTNCAESNFKDRCDSWSSCHSILGHYHSPG